ncbi:MAG: hypothetical protein HC861_01445 [Rhodospirillaceae bacterium]|nr:hypothetical protein [Rhodospirillaceae bacterium]
MKAIADIEVGQLQDALAWALRFVEETFGRSPDQIAARPQGVVAFASARILYTDDIDFPAGDRRLYDRLMGEFQSTFDNWMKNRVS